MIDLKPAPCNANKMRREWGLQNVVGMKNNALPGNDAVSMNNQNAFRQQKVRARIAHFTRTAVYPQQLTVPRQYATTREGCWVFKILEGREIPSDNGAKYREKGIRVVVQENAQQARFIMSPLFGSKHDALSWAVKEMGAEA